jgi:hypothetical protein
VGQATARALAYRSPLKEASLYPDSAWSIAFIGGSSEFRDGTVRRLDARSFFFFYATGITPAMPSSGSAPDPRTRLPSWMRESGR